MDAEARAHYDTEVWRTAIEHARKAGVLGVKEIEDRISTYDDHYIICPFSGHKHSDSWEYFRDEDATESERLIDCVECDREFIATQSVHVTYETRPKEEADG